MPRVHHYTLPRMHHVVVGLSHIPHSVLGTSLLSLNFLCTYLSNRHNCILEITQRIGLLTLNAPCQVPFRPWHVSVTIWQINTMDTPACNRTR
ncbi:unnamed protein product [Rodentolepis nana]|uniref:Uncharacterized protein n=1 Tax=Rodentolepis nana TaxID=102285 RepID=A0A3P7VBJ0_RODNA|nr:unnamed protein product [Rodentolepis nana]